MEWDYTVITMNEPDSFLGHTELTGCKMQELVMNTIYPDSTREDTKRFVKILEVPIQIMTLIRSMRLQFS